MRITLEQLNELKTENKQRGNKEIPPNTSIKVYDYHIKSTGLKNSDLLLYEIIYGFTVQTPEGLYKGSSNYLATRININVPNTLKALKKLTEKGYIEKLIINGHPCYRVTDIDIPSDMQNNYTIIDHTYIKAGLKGIKLLIFSYINGLTNNCEYYWYTQSFIANKFNVTPQSVCNCLKQLEEEDFIVKTTMSTICDIDWLTKPIYISVY